MASICALRIVAGQTPTLHSVQQASCNAADLPKEARASIRIRFRDGQTFCGENPNIIACRADLELTEYNVRDYRFIFSSAIAAPIGSGPVSLNLLHAMLHEMGHWIGLEHLNSGESIMAGSLSQARCINRATIDLLARGSRKSPPTRPEAFTLNP
jgi:hypothetical protein